MGLRTGHQRLMDRAFMRTEMSVPPPIRTNTIGSHWTAYAFVEMYMDALDGALADAQRRHDARAVPHQTRYSNIFSDRVPLCAKCVADSWLAGADHGGLMFTDLCEVFGLDPEAVRARVSKYVQRPRGT